MNHMVSFISNQLAMLMSNLLQCENHINRYNRMERSDERSNSDSPSTDRYRDIEIEKVDFFTEDNTNSDL